MQQLHTHDSQSMPTSPGMQQTHLLACTANGNNTSSSPWGDRSQQRSNGSFTCPACQQLHSCAACQQLCHCCRACHLLEVGMLHLSYAETPACGPIAGPPPWPLDLPWERCTRRNRPLPHPATPPHTWPRWNTGTLRGHAWLGPATVRCSARRPGAQTGGVGQCLCGDTAGHKTGCLQAAGIS